MKYNIFDFLLRDSWEGINLMNVTFLSIYIFGETIGGIENHIYYLSKYLHKLGVKVTIVVPIIDEKEHVEEKVTNDGIIIKKVYIKSRFNWLFNYTKKLQGDGIGLLFAFINKLKFNLYFHKIYREIVKTNPDIVHQHDYLSNIYVTKKLSKIYPIVFTNHTGEYLYLNKNIFSKLLQRILISHYSYIIAPSYELLPNKSNAIYIPNGVDTDYFRNFGEEWKRKFRKNNNLDGKYIFLCPRRWAPTKGIIYLARAINKLSDFVLNKSVFLFAGSDYEGYSKYSEEIKEELYKAKHADVRLLGNLNQEELRNYYNASDVVVIPSLMEATSLAALEAMACGVPVLSTNVGGMTQIIHNGINGWLIPPKSSESIAQMIEEIVRGTYNLDEMGKKAMEIVNEKYSWELIAKEVLGIYNKILNNN